MTRSDRLAEERLADRRATAASEWQAIKRSVRSEIGFSPDGSAWTVGIAGLAFGLELARRLLGDDRPATTGSSRTA